MPDDSEILNEMLEKVVALEDKLKNFKSDANSREILERLRKLRESLTKLAEEMKSK